MHGKLLLVALAFPALAGAFLPTGLFSPKLSKFARTLPGLQSRASIRLGSPISGRANSAARWLCSDGREAVNDADFQYLHERGACGVGFIASKHNRATHEIVEQVRFQFSAANRLCLVVQLTSVLCSRNLTHSPCDLCSAILFVTSILVLVCSLSPGNCVSQWATCLCGCVISLEIT
jgi:hypothetical protein